MGDDLFTQRLQRFKQNENPEAVLPSSFEQLFQVASCFTPSEQTEQKLCPLLQEPSALRRGRVHPQRPMKILEGLRVRVPARGLLTRPREVLNGPVPLSRKG